MRLNSLITASLALALLSHGHLSQAATSHIARRGATHKAAAPVAKRRIAKQQDTAATTTKRVAGRKARVRDNASPTKTARVSATSHSRKGKNARAAAPMVQRASTRGSKRSRKGASQDLLVAAGASDVAASTVTKATTVNPKLQTVEQEASTPVILPTLYNKRGRLIVPPPLRGSHEILVRQNLVADRDGLDRIQDDADLARMREARLLVPIPVSGTLDVDERLPVNRRYTRPWTAQFLVTLSRAHYARFHTTLQVNSAVRTVEFQQRLQRTNGNAAPAEGETASPHLTGQAVDLAKHGLSMTEIAWLRGYLLPLSQQGRLDVEEEFQQACFHISVYKKYLPATPKREIATGQHGGTTALAAGLR